MPDAESKPQTMRLNVKEAGEVKIEVDDTGRVFIQIGEYYSIEVKHAKLIKMDDPLRGYDIVYGEA